MRVLVHGLRQLAVAGGVLVLAQQEQHDHRRREQDARLAQRIKRTVIQNHARDDVHRAGLLQAVFDVARGNLVVDRVIGVAEGRQRRDGVEQQRDHRHADAHAQQVVHRARERQGLFLGPVVHGRLNARLFLLLLLRPADFRRGELLNVRRGGLLLGGLHLALQRALLVAEPAVHPVDPAALLILLRHGVHLRAAFRHASCAPRCARRSRESS